MDKSRLLSQVEAWKFMSVNDLLRFCKTDRQLYQICQDNRTWQYLLQRDFLINYSGQNVQQLYFRYKEIIEYFTPKFPIITENAVEVILNFLPREYWQAWTKIYDMLRNEDRSEILEFTEVCAIMDEMETYDQSPEEFDQYIENEDSDLILVLDGYVSKCRQAEQYIFKKFEQYIPDVEELAEKVEKNGCDLLIPYSQIPVKLFINRKPKIVNINIELVTYVEMSMINLLCGPMVNQMKDNIIALL